MSRTPSLHVVIPAAGAGRRMTGEIPKQYLPLAGRTLIEWSLAPFLLRSDISQIVVVLPSDDVHFAELRCARDGRVRAVSGGEERVDSVACGVAALSAQDDDWVLVHDAARPCLHPDDLSKLIAELKTDAIGGLLAAPVTDTLKSSDAKGRVHGTVPRDQLWRALTPQMFRYGLLQRALHRARRQGSVATDESAAVEALGVNPRLVSGRADNIKVTVPEDLAHAEHILRGRET